MSKLEMSKVLMYEFHYDYIKSRLLTVNFAIDAIAKILQNLNPNKAHGHDKISIRMLQLSGNSICKPLELIFQQAMKSGSFPSEWKKGDVVPIHKRDDNV